MNDIIFAFDKLSARTVDVQGFMHVEGCNISKATVNPYMGSEIPNWKALGLNPSKVYNILRPAEELQKAAHTFNNLPLLDGHKEVAADDLDNPELKKYIVGSTGTDAVFDNGYLKNSLVLWTSGAIDGVTTKEQTELSCAYRYEYVPEPGYFNGVAYDGKMRNIVGNHVALVEVGRAGSDVVVADSATTGATAPHKEKRMAKPPKTRTITPQGQVVRGALLAYLRPRLASDAAIAPGEISTIVRSIAPGSYSDQVEKLAEDVAETFNKRCPVGEVIDTEDLAGLLSVMEGEFANDDAVLSEDGECCKDCGKKMGKDKVCADCSGAKKTKTPSTASDETPVSRLMEKISEYDIPEAGLREINDLVTALINPTSTGDAMPEEIQKTPEEIAADEAAAAAAAAPEAPAAPAPPAMDEALLRKSIINEVGARFQAAKEVSAIVGEVDALAADSAEAIYKLALDAKGIDTKDVHPSAFRAMLKMIPVQTEAPAPVLAADAASISDFHTRYPHASAVKKG